MSNFKTNFDGLAKEDRGQKVVAFLGTSLFQDYSYNKTYLDILQSVQENFKETYVLVADKTVAHVLKAFGYSDNESLEIAEQESCKWRNSPLIKNTLDQLDENKEILYWDIITKDASYEFCKNFVNKLYETNEDFRQHIDIASCQAFGTYMTKFVNKINRKNFKPVDSVFYCREFLLEECAGVLSLAEKYAKDEVCYIIYPKPKQENNSCIMTSFSCLRIMLDAYHPTKMKLSFITMEKKKYAEKKKEKSNTDTQQMKKVEINLENVNLDFIPVSYDEFAQIIEKQLITSIPIARQIKKDSSFLKNWNMHWDAIKQFIPDVRDTSEVEPNIVPINTHIKKASK